MDHNKRSNYDPNVVITAADAKLAAGDVQGGQTLYQSSLFNWVDDAQFGGPENIDQLREAIATLWIAYAHYLQKAKQFKTAAEAYEDATKCPVSGRTGRIWLDYARFLEDRGKVRSAQQVYLRALVGNKSNNNETGGHVQDEQDQNLLWSEFLTMMQTKQPDLTLTALKKAVQKEHTNVIKTEENQPDVAGSSGGPMNIDNDGMYDDLPASKRPRIDSNSNIGIKQETINAPTITTEHKRTHVVTASDVKIEETALLDITQNVKNDPLFLSTWMIRDGDAPPQAPEPPLFDAAPPKLSDPSGKDLLGAELALQLVQRLLEPNTGNATLQVCRGLWMLTALTEDQTSKKLKRIDEELREDNKKIRARLDERLSVAGAAEIAVRTMNEIEIAGFESSCNQQRQTVLNEIAWDFRKLLWVQQQFLTKLKIPGFRGPTVDAGELEYQSRICSYLHSAFFLRQRIGESAHTTMMKSQEKRLIDLKNNPRPVVPGGGRSRSPSPVLPHSRSPKRGGTSSPVPMATGAHMGNAHYPIPIGSAGPPYPSHLQLPPPPPPPQPSYLQQQQPPPQAYGMNVPGAQGVPYPPPPPQQQQQQQQQSHNMMPPGYSQQQQQQQQPNPPYYR
jgi:tetratricopeptide (TPR) repeat protein